MSLLAARIGIPYNRAAEHGPGPVVLTGLKPVSKAHLGSSRSTSAAAATSVGNGVKRGELGAHAAVISRRPQRHGRLCGSSAHSSDPAAPDPVISSGREACQSRWLKSPEGSPPPSSLPPSSGGASRLSSCEACSLEQRSTAPAGARLVCVAARCARSRRRREASRRACPVGPSAASPCAGSRGTAPPPTSPSGRARTDSRATSSARASRESSFRRCSRSASAAAARRSPPRRS